MIPRIILAIVTSTQFAFAQLSSEDSASARNSYWINTSYSPTSDEIYARYLKHDGFGGMQLNLQPDRRFIITNYSDVLDTLTPAPRLAGTFAIKRDTLVLTFRA